MKTNLRNPGKGDYMVPFIAKTREQGDTKKIALDKRMTEGAAQLQSFFAKPIKKER